VPARKIKILNYDGRFWFFFRFRLFDAPIVTFVFFKYVPYTFVFLNISLIFSFSYDEVNEIFFVSLCGYDQENIVD